MRSNDSLRRLGANFVKMLVLVMCFATVFAIVMTADLSGIGTDSAGNVAEADTYWPSSAVPGQLVVDEMTVGTSGETVTQQIQKLVHNTSAGGSFEYSLDFNSTGLNVNLYDYASIFGWEDSGSVSPYNPSAIGEFGGQENDDSDAGEYTTVISAFNLKVPEVITNLASRKFQVSVRIEGDLTVNAGRSGIVGTHHEFGLGLVGYENNTLVHASSYASDGWCNASNASLRLEAWGDAGKVTSNQENWYPNTNRWVSTRVNDSKGTNVGFLESMTNLVAVFYRESGYSQRGGGYSANTSIVFTITLPENIPSDGSAPKYTGAWEANIFGGKTFADSASDDFAPYRNGSVTANSSSINLGTVATAANGFSVNDTHYAKKLTLNLSDGDDTSPTYYTGLAGVTIQKDGGAQKTINTTGTESDTDWYASYTVEAARDTGTLTLYFKANGTYNITVSDTGGLSLFLTVTVSGIDTTASVGATVAAKYIDTDQDNLYWITEADVKQLTLRGVADDSSITTNQPMVWFIDVAHNDENGFPDAPEDKSADISSWYRFAVGASTHLSSSDLSVTMIGGGTQDLSLSGYYAMRVYGMDLTGNITSAVYYFKADKTPIAGVDLVEKSYDTQGDTLVSPSDKGGDGILTDENDAWAPSALTVKIGFTPSLSGNRVQIVDASGNEYYVWVYGGAIAKITKANAVDLSSDWTAVGDGSYTRGGATVSYDAGILTLVYSVTGGVIEVSSQFGVMKGADNLWQNATPAYPNGGEAIHIWVDTAAPQEVVFSDGYMNKTSGEMPSGKARVWYNKDWLYMPTASIDLGNDALYRVYYHIVRYEDDFKDYSSVVAAGETYKKLTTSGWKFVEAATFGTSYSFNDILETDESGNYLAGYYVVYISAVDRAGNVTQSVWGAFVDANEYTLGTQIHSDYRDKFGTDVSSKFVTALGTLKDGNVVAQESYKRGETVYFRVSSIPDGYVPYQVFKLDADGLEAVDNPLYTHPDDNTEKAFVESGLNGAGYASFESADTLELLIDRADAGKLPAATDGENSGNGLVVFSFRQVVSATPDGSTTYIGTDIEPHITVTDVNNSELETLIKEDGLSFYTLNKYADNTSGVSGATIRNAGDYYLTLARAHSEYYVLSNPTEYTQGDSTVVRNYSEFTVTRVALGIDASGSGTYGDITADNLSEIITVSALSGLVGDDIGLVGDDIGSGIKKLAGYSAPVWTVAGFSEGYLDAGTYELTLSGLNLTNYSLTVGDASVTVTPKEISFAAVGDEAVFGDIGDSLPSSVYDITIAKSALNNTAGVAIASDAAAVAEIFGVEASAVRESEDGDNWIVTVGSEGLKLDTSDSDYTEGYLNANETGYKITRGTVDISANYKASFEEGGVLVVTQRTVTVTPNENQSFNIKAGEGGTIKVQVTFGNNLVDSLISGYMTVKIPDPEVSDDWAVNLADLSHIDNPYGVTNVLIQAASGTYTVFVNIATGGTFVITYTGLDFEQEYGYRWDFGKLASTAGNYTIDYRDANGTSQEAPAAPTFVFNVSSGYISTDVLANGIGKYYLTPTVTGFDGDSSLKISDYTYEFRYVSVDGGEPIPVESIQIVPANVTVTAVANSGVNSKVYGDVEPAWAFTYEFEGLPEEYLTKYGTPSISGIVRADASGKAAGTRYDDAGEYGAFNAGISCKDRNLNVTLGAGALNTASFVINPKTITLGANDFVGDDKFFDGTSDASAVANINFPAGAIINNDTVTLVYTANFVLNGETVSAIGDGYEIAFTNIALDGADSGNYTLATPEFITQGGKFSIIRAKISLTTSYYTLLKVFDGSTAINGDYLTISPDAGLELYKASMVVSGFFSSANAGERVSATLVLTLASLPYEEEHLEDIFGNNYASLGVEIAPIDADDHNRGTVITFNGFIGKIEKRTVNFEDVVLEITDNKVYDGTTDVVVSYDFTEEFKSAITGFAPADVGFEISASVPDKNALATPYKVTLSGATVSGANYVAAAGLTDLLETDAKFTINRRPLTLSIEFATEIYSGVTSPPIGGSAIVEGLVAGESATVGSFTAIYSKGNTPWSYVDLDQLIDGNYYHDVLVQSYTVTPGTGFDWRNYQFILADGTSAGEESGTDPFQGANLLLEGAAILNPRPVNMLLNAVKALSKVYDGTTAAELDFSGAFGYGVADGFVSNEHKAAVLKYITYTANFGTANATPSGLKLTWGNFKIDSASASDADKDIIGSYSFGYTGSQTNIATDAQITHAPLAVEFTLPEKAYDGSQYLNLDENNVKTTLIGSIVGEPDSYRVVVIAAGYAGGDELNVNDNGVNAGFVYGFSLVNNTRADVINYELVFASETENLAGFTAVADLGANTTLDPSLHYYRFNSHDYWYLNYSELEKLEGNAELFAKLNIISVFNYGNEVMYALEVRETLTGDDETALTTLGASRVATRRADAYGKITPVQLAFEVITTDGDAYAGGDYVFNEAAFVKKFDDSTAIDAVYGALDAEAGTYDFKLKLTYPDGTPIGDVDFEVKGVEVRFADANVGTRKDVIFRIVGLETDGGEVNAGNYSFNADGTCTVKSLGTIEKASVIASISGDATVTYGEEWNYSVSYKTATGSKSVYVDAEGYAYIKTGDYADAGFSGATEGRVTYVTADNGVTFTEGTEGDTYYRLTGKFGLTVPVADNGKGVTIVRDGKFVGAGVGTYSSVVPAGNADNFSITSSGGITVTVDKAQLIVAPTDAAEGEYAYSGTYYGSIPVPALAAQSGLAAWDDFATVVNDLTVGFTLSTATTPAAITRRATPSFKLSEGYYKLFVSGEFSNYAVQLGDGSTEYKLYLALPTLAESTFTVKESLTKVYDAKAVTGADILNGLTASDTAKIGWADGADCTNAGTVNFARIEVKRTIGDYWYVAPGANEADEISWTSATEGTYTITQRALTVRATSSLNFTYDGTDHQLDRSKLAATSAGGVGDTSGFIANADIKLLFNGEEVSAMRDAGGYTVSISLSASDARNYAVTNNVGTIVVAKAPITVSVDAASKTYDVTDGVSGNEAIRFTVASGAVGGDSLTEDDFTVTYRDSSGSVVSAIPTAGVYNYTITCADPNYTVGGGTGNISATISGVSYKSGDTTFAQITFSAPVTVDYKLQDTALAEGTPYWSIVEENVRALSDENYDTNGIVRLQLTANGGTVSSLPDGSSVTIRALLPEGVSADNKVFYVNSSGGLTELTDYQIANGYITYTTSYISNLVFVGMPSFVLAWWVYLLIAVLVVLIIAAAILIAVLAKLRRAPDPVEREEEPFEPELVPEPVVAADIAPEAPVIEPVTYDAPAAVSKHGQPPIIGIR